MGRSTPVRKPFCAVCKKKHWRKAMNGYPVHFDVKPIARAGRAVVMRCQCGHEYRIYSRTARRWADLALTNKPQPRPGP